MTRMLSACALAAASLGATFVTGSAFGTNPYLELLEHDN